MTLSELEEIQKQVQESYTVKDEVDILNRTYITGKDPSTTNETGKNVEVDKSSEFEEFKSMSFYFDNDIPLVGNTSTYDSLYNTYINKPRYINTNLKDFINLYVKR
jgi:hypothetical protein